ncbi:MAG: class I tRNA ligase family protein, partial [Opitutales bacterium]|nr:class I tRNA ligase family protein [Opitutales bacterium]
QTLLLLHPFTPFITEELWHSMGFGKDGEYIQNVSPKFIDEIEGLGISIDERAAAETEKLKDFVAKSRALKAQCKVGAKRDSKMFLLPADAQCAEIFSGNLDKLLKLAGAQSIEIVSAESDKPAALTALGTVYLEIADAVDMGEEIKRLQKELAKLEGFEKATLARLSNEAFTSKAPPKVIEGAKKQLEECRVKIAEIGKLLKSYGA